MKISVIIPAFNEEKYIKYCLESITANAPACLLEIIVIDNACTDNTAKIVKKFKNVKVVRENKKGLTCARQKGLITAKGDLLAYVDADSVISNQWFNIVRREFRKNRELVCLSGPYIYYDLPNWRKKVAIAYNNYFLASVSKLSKHMVLGGNFVARREALLKMGGFDTQIKFYGEDVNIGRRLKKIGEIKFLKEFYILTSARRLKSEGMIKTGATYAANYITESIFEKPLTKKYKDIR